MLLDLDKFPVPMKRVYLLSEELKHDPNQIGITQELTLDTSRPKMGLKGTHGLFASEEWWSNVKQQTMPLEFVSGTIKRVYAAGQNATVNNTVDLVLEDGSETSVGIYINDSSDAGLFRLQSKVSFVYALDELKRQPARDGGINYSKVVVEMAVSETPS